MRQSGTTSTPRRWVVVAPALILVVPLGAACSGSGAASTADPAGADGLADAELVLRFDDVAVPGDAVPTVTNDGDVPATISVATFGGGRLTWAEGWEGGGVRTPAYGPAAGAPAAALVAEPTADALQPREHDFTLGVDFSSDGSVRGRSGDDGDNLVQRGRFDGRAQLKLQLDHGVPSCRLAGADGAVVVSAGEAVMPRRWYRLTCERAAGLVLLRLKDLESDQSVGEWREDADPGDIRFGDVPVAVGAKVSDSGRIDPAGTDQFHGVIDRVYIDIS